MGSARKPKQLRVGRVARMSVFGAGLLSLGLMSIPAHSGIVYSALEGGLWRVFYQENLDASPVALSAGMGEVDAGAPRLSPDGQSVAVEVTGKGIVVCQVAAPHSCSALRVKGEPAARPAWDTQTGEIAFVQYSLTPAEENSEIFITGNGRSSVEPLIRMTGIQDYPDISPDGRSLVFSSGLTLSLYRAAVQVVQHLWVMDLVSGVSRQLSTSGARDIHPRWSPAGDRIAFASDRSGRFEIWMVESDGGQARQITQGDGSKTWPTWSPDGTEILCTVALNGQQTLAIVEVATGLVRAFRPFSPGDATQLRDPDWR